MPQTDVMSEQTERQRQIALLLRHLAVGLSSYRLFPGDTEQASFVAAVARIQEAAELALGSGPIAIEIHGRSFVTPDGPLPDNETTDRLGLACYERRVERLRVRAAPSSAELAAVYDALTRTAEEVAAAGGVGTLLSDAGVTSLTLSHVEPQAIDKAVAPEELTPEQAELWERLQTEEPMTLADELEAEASETGASLYGRLRNLVEALPPDVMEDPELYRRIHRAVVSLPKRVRSDLMAVLVKESRTDPLAARMLSSLTDHQLGSYLAELERRDEHDPIELANTLVHRGARQDVLVDLVRDLSAGPPAPPQPADAGEEGAEPVNPDGEAVRVAAAQMAAEGPSGGSDAIAVRSGFPASPEAFRPVALNTLRDYLAAEDDLERLQQVLDMWVKEVRASLLGGDTGTTGLMDAVEAARDRSSTDHRTSLFAAAKRRAIDPVFLDELFGPDRQIDADRLVTLLEPFGEAAVEGLLDTLGDESDRSRRATLVSMLAGLAARYPAPVEARLDDDRWYVVRNAVNILHKAGGGAELVPLMQKVEAHDHAAVRREVIWGLVSVLGAEAASHMRRFVADHDPTVRERAIGFLGGLVSAEAVEVLSEVASSAGDPSLRRRALDELSHNRSPDAITTLRRLASFRNRPRLPRSLRRHARKLLRQRRRSA